jgi:hypothetical protein
MGDGGRRLFCAAAADPFRGVILDVMVRLSGMLSSHARQTSGSMSGVYLNPHRGEDDMSSKTHKGGSHHEVAAEHHENAAHHHREAAKHYDSGEHEKAGHHAHVAHAHGLHATHHAHEAAKHHAEHHK